MTTEVKNIERIVKMMIKHKVDSLAIPGEIELKLSPLALIEKHAPVKIAPGGSEDDLYYSATTFKDKK